MARNISTSAQIATLLHLVDSFEQSTKIGTDEIIGNLVTAKGNDMKLKFIRRTSGWVVGVDVYTQINGDWNPLYVNNGAATKALQDAWQAASGREFKYRHGLQNEQRAIAHNLLCEALGDE